jgi:hypothetical protein
MDASRARDAVGRIFSGTNPGSLPYVGAGAVVALDLVLTAAHILPAIGADDETMIVQVGPYLRKVIGITRLDQPMAPHPAALTTTQRLVQEQQQGAAGPSAPRVVAVDVALLRLSTRLPPTVVPIPLSSRLPQEHSFLALVSVHVPLESNAVVGMSHRHTLLNPADAVSKFHQPLVSPFMVSSYNEATGQGSGWYPSFSVSKSPRLQATLIIASMY